MKTIGKIAVAVVTLVVLGATGWLVGSGLQGKTLKDTLPGQQIEQNVDQNQGDENVNDENTDGTENDGEQQEPEATSVAYDEERNVLSIG